MTQRIILCTADALAVLSSQPHVELGRLAEGTWAAVGDPAFWTLADRAVDLRLLYFSLEEYQHGIRDLSADEVAAVLRKRASDWSSRALDDALDCLYYGKRRALELTALGCTLATGPGAAALVAHFVRGLVLLARLTGEGRYDDEASTALLSFVQDGEATLLHETLLAGQAIVADTAAAQRYARLAQMRREFAERQAHALERFGHPVYGIHLPYIEPERAYFIRPRDAAVLETLKRTSEPFVLWRDGVVAPWKVRLLADLTSQGKSATLLYLNTGELFADMRELTAAQLDRELKSRLKGAPTSLRALEVHLHSLWLEHLLLKCNVRTRAQVDRAFFQMMDEQVKQETAALQDALALHPGWLHPVPRTAIAAREALSQAEQGLVEDAAFLAELAHRAGRQGLRSQLLALLAALRQDAAQLGPP